MRSSTPRVPAARLLDVFLTIVMPERDRRALTSTSSLSVLVARRMRRPLFVRRKRVLAIAVPTPSEDPLPVPDVAVRPDRPTTNVPA
ncbi:MAG: hypothetical protein QOI73_2285 [Solirubrobacteraceae bacterium]|nr:hypothetical protein [Solirubrobacteraceae bacterium]